MASGLREGGQVSHDAAAVRREEALLPARHPWTRLPAVGLGLAVLGAAVAAAAGGDDPERFLASWLVAFVYFLTLALGCLYFVLMHTAAQGGWGVVVRRVAENVASTLPLFALLFVPVALGLPHLYPWSRPDAAADALLRWKRPYLNEGFFYARSALYLLVWSAIALWFSRLSRRQDETADPALSARLRRWSGPLLIPLGLTHTFAAFDWVMSLDPRWYSTIYGVYSFSGALVAAVAFLSIAAVLLPRSGLPPGMWNAEHRHDLGKLLFTFTAFWAYIGFSQYLLIWYGNIPEETVFYRLRLEGAWLVASVALAMGHFVVPFFFLLPRAVKRDPRALAGAAAWMLLMHLLDVYWMVVPNVHGHPAGPGILDAAALLAVGGAFLAVFGWLLRRHALVPVGDPRLSESLAFENV
jgi:hypothetical protein